MQILTKPLKKSEIDPTGEITVIVPIELSDLIDCDIDSLNNLVEDLILDESVSGVLSGIGYSVAGHTKDDKVLIRVNTSVEYYD
jgi:hypothetical protein